MATAIRTETSPEAKLTRPQRPRQPRWTTELLPLFPRQGEWTEADYLALPDINRIIELSEGRLVIPDLPTDPHQFASGELFAALRLFVRERGLGHVRYAPLRVRLWPGKI